MCQRQIYATRISMCDASDAKIHKRRLTDSESMQRTAVQGAHTCLTMWRHTMNLQESHVGRHG